MWRFIGQYVKKGAILTPSRFVSTFNVGCDTGCGGEVDECVAFSWQKETEEKTGKNCARFLVVGLQRDADWSFMNYESWAMGERRNYNQSKWREAGSGMEQLPLSKLRIISRLNGSLLTLGPYICPADHKPGTVIPLVLLCGQSGNKDGVFFAPTRCQPHFHQITIHETYGSNGPLSSQT